MNTESKSPIPGMDQFASFWQDFMSRMSTPSGSAAGMGAAPWMTPAALEQARKAFFEAMSKHADEFMRSEAFLGAMKQSMENALAWQNMMNQFLQKSAAAAQVPSRADADHVVLLVRGMEERVLDKLEQLAARIEKLERERSAAK